MPTSPPLASEQGVEALSAAARLLATRGIDAAADVLEAAVDVLRCDDLVLRGPDLVQIASGGHRVPAPRASERWVLDAPARVRGHLRGLLTAGASAPFTPAQATVLSAYADLLGLALAAQPVGVVSAAARLVLDEEAERAQLAAALEEGVGPALVTVRYTAERVAAGLSGPDALDEPVRAALAAVRSVQRDLRAQALDAGLGAALRGLAARGGGDRPADGRRALRVTVVATDPGLDAVAPAVAVTVQRVVEAVLRGAGGRVEVIATTGDHGVKLRIESADIGYDASELDRWARRAAALGGYLQPRPTGVELSLPDQPPAREGHDDDRPDL